jgi:hypothetical protein
MMMRTSRLMAVALVVVIALLAGTSPARGDDVTTVVAPGERPIGAAWGDLWVAGDGSVQSYPWGNLGGIATSDPDYALSSILPSPPYLGTDIVFVRGIDGAVWETRAVPGRGGVRWWGTRGGLATSGPGASATRGHAPPGDPESYVDVFVRGTDGAVWHLRRTPAGVWSTWQPIGGQITSDPDSAANATDTGVDVVARGVEGAVWMAHADDTAWGPWFPLGGQITSGPSISSDGTTSVVAARGVDGAVWVRTLTVQGWTDWYPIGGLAGSDPDVRVYNGHATILVRGVDGHLWRATASDNTWIWNPLSYGD